MYDDMSNVTVKRVETEEEMEAAVGIRFRVFVDEQSVPPEIELDEYDAVATHAIAMQEAAPSAWGECTWRRARRELAAWPSIGRTAAAAWAG